MSDQTKNEVQAQDADPEQPTQQEALTPPPENAAPSVTPGMLLAARRDELGLSPERVAEQLKMTPRRVLEIESDNPAITQNRAIYRGFVRAYAKVLRMDPEPLVAMIADEVAKKDVLAPARNQSLDTFSESRLPFMGQYSSQTKRVAIAIILLILLICAMLAQRVGWLPTLSMSKFNEARTETPAASAEPVAKAEVPAPASAPESEQTKQVELPPVDVASQLASAPTPAPGQPVAGGAVQPAPAPAPAVEANTAAAPAAAPVDTRNALVLKCREKSWIELKRSSGEVVASRYVAAGETASFTVNEPMHLTIGNAPAVQASLRGTRLNIYTAGDSKVVRLNIK